MAHRTTACFIARQKKNRVGEAPRYRGHCRRGRLHWLGHRPKFAAEGFNVDGNVNFPLLETSERVFRKVGSNGGLGTVALLER